MPNPTVTAGDLVDQLYRVAGSLNGAIAAVNNIDSSQWNDTEARRRLLIAYDEMDKLCRHMAVRARLSPVEDYCSLDAIAAGIEQRASQPEYAEDRWAERADYRRKIGMGG